MVNLLEVLYAIIGGLALIAFALLVQGRGQSPQAERRRRLAQWLGIAAVVAAIAAAAIYRLLSTP